MLGWLEVNAGEVSGERRERDGGSVTAKKTTRSETAGMAGTILEALRAREAREAEGPAKER